MPCAPGGRRDRDGRQVCQDQVVAERRKHDMRQDDSVNTTRGAHERRKSKKRALSPASSPCDRTFTTRTMAGKCRGRCGSSEFRPVLPVPPTVEVEHSAVSNRPHKRPRVGTHGTAELPVSITPGSRNGACVVAPRTRGNGVGEGDARLQVLAVLGPECASMCAKASKGGHDCACQACQLVSIFMMWSKHGAGSTPQGNNEGSGPSSQRGDENNEARDVDMGSNMNDDDDDGDSDALSGLSPCSSCSRKSSDGDECKGNHATSHDTCNCATGNSSDDHHNNKNNNMMSKSGVPPLGRVIFRQHKTRRSVTAASSKPYQPDTALLMPMLPASSLVLDAVFVSDSLPEGATGTTTTTFNEVLRTRLLASNVVFQVEATIHSVSGAPQRMDMAPFLQSKIQEALEQRQGSVSYTVGQATYHLDMYSWVVTHLESGSMQPVRAVVRTHTTSHSGAGGGGEPVERELVHGTAASRVHVRYRGRWVVLSESMSANVLGGGLVTLSVKRGTVPGGALLGGEGSSSDDLVSEDFTSDTRNLLLFHHETAHAYPFRVAGGAHATAVIARSTPAEGVRALADHWHWGPGTSTRAMMACMAMAASTAAPPLPQHVGMGRVQQGLLPLRVFGSNAEGTVLQSLPLAMTTCIMEEHAAQRSRLAPRIDTGKFPYIPSHCEAQEMRYATQCQRFIPTMPDAILSEPMGRVLDPELPGDNAKIQYIIRYMGATAKVGHVLQVVEIIDPVRLPAVHAVMRVRGRQLGAMKTAVDEAQAQCEQAGDDPALPSIQDCEVGYGYAAACASSDGASTGNPLMLFHGTKARRPADVVCAGGPSMDHSADAAFYGRGIYGSTSAAYVQRAYAHRVDERCSLLSDVRQVLAFVGVAGNVYNARTVRPVHLDTVRSTAPTIRNSSAAGTATKLNVHSISGYLDMSCASRNFAFFYDNDVAPAYLITYRPAAPRLSEVVMM